MFAVPSINLNQWLLIEQLLELELLLVTSNSVEMYKPDDNMFGATSDSRYVSHFNVEMWNECLKKILHA